MKDIGNYALEKVQVALKHLDEAVSRLETAAAQVQTQLPLAEDAAVFEQKLADLSKQNSELKESAGRVAGRLDVAIGRLAAALKD